MVWYGLIWFGLVGGGVVGGYVWECSRMLNVLGDSKKFHGWVVVVYLQLQCLLRSRPPESEIEIELERTWEASRVDLEMVWTRV